MRKLIHGIEYLVSDRIPCRADPVGNLITNPNKWTAVKTPIKLDDLSGKHTEEYQRFSDWFEKECIGYYQYLYRGTFLFSEEQDAIKYYLGYYYD